MKTFDIKISVINPDYNAEYEKEYGFLERQYENPKFERESGWTVKDLTEYRYRENIALELEYSKNDERKKCSLNNVCVLEILSDKEIVGKFIVSKSLVSSTREIDRQKYDKGYFYFYLKPNIEFARLTDFIYIAADEIPEELMQTEQ